MEDGVLDEKNIVASYNLKAYFFSFMYYFYMKQWVFGLIALVLTIILPFQLYFAISFIESWVLWRMNCKGKAFGTKWKKWGIIVSCLSVFLCVILKAWLYKFLGSL